MPASPRHHARLRTTARTARRGATFLEAILGVVLLGLVTTSLVGAVTFMRNAETRLARHLGAAELANRLILQLIDDRDSLPNPSLPLEYSDALYRWELDEQPVRFIVQQQGVAVDSSASGVGSGVSLDRVKLVIVRVWLAPESGGSTTYTTEVPSVVITRLVDPLAFSNPDSLDTLLNTPGGIDRLMQVLMGIEQGTSGSTTGQ